MNSHKTFKINQRITSKNLQHIKTVVTPCCYSQKWSYLLTLQALGILKDLVRVIKPILKYATRILAALKGLAHC